MTIEQKLIKLTRPDLTTYGGYQYVLGQKHIFPGIGPLCSSGWSHAYLTQPLAELLNPTHAAYSPYNVYEAVGIVGLSEGDLKVGCSSLTLVRRLPAIHPTTEQRVAFGIAAALHVCADPTFVQWASKWLSGQDRTARAAAGAAWAAWAARAAAGAAWAAEAARAAWAAWAAEAAAWAAKDSQRINLPAIASWAVSLKDTSCIVLPDTNARPQYSES